MTDFKKGDRVRVCWMDDYDKMVSKSLGVPLHIGRTGTVEDTDYNPKMAVYGQGYEVLVSMDDDNSIALWTDKNLELIEEV